MHFVMHAFSNHVKVLHNVTPLDLLAQVAVLSDGVVVACLHQLIPLLWRGGGLMHFVMHAFSNHVKVLHNVTPLDLLAQVAVLSDGVVVACLHQLIPLLWRGGGLMHFVMHAFNNHVKVLHQLIPLLWRGGGRSPTGWLCRFCTS